VSDELFADVTFVGTAVTNVVDISTIDSDESEFVSTWEWEDRCPDR
jgi:hypothetical protein